MTKDSRLRRTVAPEVLNFCYHTKTDVMGHLEIIARADMRSGHAASTSRSILHNGLTKKIVYNLIIRPALVGVGLP